MKIRGNIFFILKQYFKDKSLILKSIFQILGSFGFRDEKLYKFEEIKPNRTLNQNKFYWAILAFICKEYSKSGEIYTTDFLHNAFKKAFLPRKRIYSDFSKKYVLVLKSTTELNTKQFKNYIENIKILCEFSELDKVKGLKKINSFIIPDEDDKNFLKWIDENIG